MKENIHHVLDCFVNIFTLILEYFKWSLIVWSYILVQRSLISNCIWILCNPNLPFSPSVALITIIKLPFIFCIWIDFILASLGGLRSFLCQLAFYRLDWNCCFDLLFLLFMKNVFMLYFDPCGFKCYVTPNWNWSC